MIIAGVDCNKTKVAVACLDVVTHELHTDTYTTKAENRAYQLYTLGTAVQKMVQSADVVYVEEAQVGKGVRASLYVAQTTGAVAAMSEKKTYFVPVSSWKKQVIGDGKATKASVSAWLNTSHATYAGQCDGDQDLQDATCIALYGLHVHAVATSLGIDRY